MGLDNMADINLSTHHMCNDTVIDPIESCYWVNPDACVTDP